MEWYLIVEGCAIPRARGISGEPFVICDNMRIFNIQNLRLDILKTRLWKMAALSSPLGQLEQADVLMW